MSTTSGNPKRIVTGQREDGTSFFASVEEAGALGEAATDGREVWRMWGSNSLPVQLPATDPWPQGADPGPEGLEAFLSSLPPDTGVRFTLVRYQPGYVDELYAVDTADIVVVLDGELVYVLDSGEEMVMRHGDVVIQNGVKKSWQNRSDQPAMIAAAVLAGKRAS